MHIATAEALILSSNLETLFPKLAERYVKCFEDMGGKIFTLRWNKIQLLGRAPGPTTGSAIWKLKSGTKWDEIPYSRSGGGCGGNFYPLFFSYMIGSMRSMVSRWFLSSKTKRQVHWTQIFWWK